MVIGAFPVMKLGVLAVRQIAKPIAEVIKARAKTHPFFRTYICMPPAQCEFSKILIKFLHLLLLYIIAMCIYLANFSV